MNERDLGRGWKLQSWADNEAAPRLVCSRNGLVLALDVDDDVVLERKTAAIADVVPLPALYELIAATAAHRSATSPAQERRP